MCEWTPPWETRPSRWTSPPLRERRRQRRVLEEGAVLDRPVDPLQVLVEHAAGADRQVADLRVAHLAGRQTDGLAGGLQRRVRVLGPEPVEHRRLGQLDGVPGPGRRAAPAVEDDERDDGIAAAARQIAVNDSSSSEAPPTSAPSTSVLREQLGGVLGLDRAAVEHGHVEQDLMNAWASCACSGVAVLPGADRPDRLVREDEPLVPPAASAIASTWTPEHELGLARFALLERLAHARDDAQALPRARRRVRRAPSRRSRRSTGAARSGRRSRRHAELDQHRRRDLAGVGALGLPVHVLREDGHARSRPRRPSET